MTLSWQGKIAALLAAIFIIALPAHADAKRGKGHHKPAAGKHGRVKAPNADPDKDGLDNRYEALVGTKPHRADSDGNGVTDGREDFDGDGVDNRTEQLAKTDPRRGAAKDGRSDADLDPDHDGLSNRGESEAGLDPHNPDTDDDDIKDGDEHAGRVSASSSTSVTIALFGGGSLTSRYDANDTDVICRVDESDDSEPPADDEDDGDDADDGDNEIVQAITDTANGNGEDDAPASCPAPAVGDTVYEADIDDNEDGRGPLFVTIDLVGGN